MEWPKGRMNMLTDLNAKGRLDNLLIRLADKELDSESTNWDFSLIEELLKFLDSHAYALLERPRSVVNAITNLLNIRPASRNQFFNAFLDILTSSKQDVYPGRIYILHYMLQSDQQDSGFSSGAPEFKEFYLQRMARILSFYTDYLYQIKNNYMKPDFPKPDTLYTHLVIYGLATYHQNDFLNNLGILLNSHSNTLFFINTVTQNDWGDKEVGLNDKELKLYFPQEVYLRQFINRVKAIDPTQLSEMEQKRRDFLLETFSHFPG
jgi:hypothetical protein